MPAELAALAAETPTPGIVERVLALKALPELADQQADDLVTLARATAPLRLEPGAILPADRSIHFLVDGSVRELRPGGPATRCDAPSALGLLEALAGVEPPEHVAEVESTTLEIAPSALVEVLEEQFELWRAFLRPVCHELLRGGDVSWVAGAEAGRRAEALSPPIELADRIACCAPLRRSSSSASTRSRSSPPRWSPSSSTPAPSCGSRKTPRAMCC